MHSTAGLCMFSCTSVRQISPFLVLLVSNISLGSVEAPAESAVDAERNALEPWGV